MKDFHNFYMAVIIAVFVFLNFVPASFYLGKWKSQAHFSKNMATEVVRMTLLCCLLMMIFCTRTRYAFIYASRENRYWQNLLSTDARIWNYIAVLPTLPKN